jgi:hypothetical protein
MGAAADVAFREAIQAVTDDYHQNKKVAFIAAEEKEERYCSGRNIDCFRAMSNGR